MWHFTFSVGNAFLFICHTTKKVPTVELSVRLFDPVQVFHIIFRDVAAVFKAKLALNQILI